MKIRSYDLIKKEKFSVNTIIYRLKKVLYFKLAPWKLLSNSDHDEGIGNEDSGEQITSFREMNNLQKCIIKQARLKLA